MRRSWLVTAVTLTLLLTAACGDSGDDGGSTAAGESVFEKYGQMSAAEREADLIELAKKEGELVVYTGYTSADKLTDAFQQKYGIKVSLYNPDNETMLQKFLQEMQAGRGSADLVDTAYAQATAIDKEGYFYHGWKPNDSLELTGESTSDGWFVTRFVAWVTAWNDDLVPAGQEPRSFQDLADPKWNGKLAIEIGDYDWYAALMEKFTADGMTHDQARALFESVMKNARVVKGHTNIGNLLASREFAITATLYIQTVAEQRAKGAPVSWLPADKKAPVPPVLAASGTGLVKDARHPAAALLYADFLFSREGQEILKREGATPAAVELQEFEGNEVIFPPIQEMVDSPAYQDEWQEIVSTVGKG